VNPSDTYNDTIFEALITQDGEIRLDKKRACLVQIVGERERTQTGNYLYPVRNILTDHRYNLRRSDMGNKTFNEMEVLAWAASGPKQ